MPRNIQDASSIPNPPLQRVALMLPSFTFKPSISHPFFFPPTLIATLPPASSKDAPPYSAHTHLS